MSSPGYINLKGDDLRNALQQLRIQELTLVLRKLSLSASGRKDVLLDRICDHFDNLRDKISSGESSDSELKHDIDYLERAYMLRHGLIAKFDDPLPNSPSSTPQPPTPPVPTSLPTPQSSRSNPDSYPLSPKYYEAFHASPFLELSSIVTSYRIKTLRENNNRPMDTLFRISLPDYTGRNRRLSKNEDNVEIQLYSFCLKGTEGQHTWPHDVQISVNNVPMSLPKNIKVSKKKGGGEKSAVATMTGLCYTGDNRISVNVPGYMPYVFVITMMKVHSVADLEKKVKIVDNSNSMNIIKTQIGSSEELCSSSLKVTLLDPISRTRVTTPSRATTCKHIQCFDLTNYLTINEKNSNWQCVVCSKTANFEDLIIDSYMRDILNSSSVVNDVEIKSDGTWSVPVDNTKEVIKKRKVEVSVEIVISDDDEDETEVKMQEEGEQVSSPMTSVLKTSTEKAAANSLADMRSNNGVVNKRECVVCGNCDNTKRCATCKSVTYCGKECQSEDWPRHKNVCQCKPKKQKKSPQMQLPEMPRFRDSSGSVIEILDSDE